MNDLEARLRRDLRSTADHLGPEPSGSGRQDISVQVAHRAQRRRRRNLAGGGVLAVGALVVGALALQPESTTRLELGDGGAADQPSTQGVVTGSMTGSMTGAARGWSTNYVDGLAPLSLPRLVSDLPLATAHPSWISSVSSNRGAGGVPAPLVVLDAGGTTPRFVVSSVQSPDELGPGSGGEEVTIDGRHGRIVSESGDRISVIWDLSPTVRVLTRAAGVDRGELTALLPTLHQVDGAWRFEPASGSDLRAVSVAPASSIESRSIGYNAAMPTSTTAADGSLSIVDTGMSNVLTVSNGGAYEYYAQLAQLWSGPTSTRSGVSIALPGGHTATGVLSLQTGMGVALAIDDRGLVLRFERYGSNTEVTVDPDDFQRSLAVHEATDADWVGLATAATAWQAQMNAISINLKGGARFAPPATAPDATAPDATAPDTTAPNTTAPDATRTSGP